MAKSSKVQAPDLTNWTDGAIVDEMAKLSMVENYAKKMRKFYREVLYARQGYDKYDENQMMEAPAMISGETFTATTSQSFPRRVDVNQLKEKYPEAAEDCTNETSQLTTRFTLNEGVENPIVNDLINLLKQELDLD